MKRLLHSSKFWTAVIAAIFNIVTFVVSTYYPAHKELFIVLIASLDGVFAVVIASIAYEDGKEKEGLAASQAYEDNWQKLKPDAEAERKSRPRHKGGYRFRSSGSSIS